MTIAKSLLDILVCPQCKGRLEVHNESGLLCPECRLRYPVRDGIPVMLVSDAEIIGD